jgi:F-type H+-transporting ATPase subunit gamma
MPGEVQEPAITLVPITSDKGLCGAVNTSIVRCIKKMVLEGKVNRSKCEIFSIGDKGSKGCMRPFPDMLKTSIS